MKPDDEDFYHPTDEAGAAVVGQKKTIFIYSPDMNFCFSLSMLFEDRYNVVTTTDPALLASSIGDYAADLVLVDSNPTDSLLLQFENLRARNARFPIILLYVYSPKTVHLDRIVRNYVDAVFYKPFEIDAVSKRIAELLQS